MNKIVSVITLILVSGLFLSMMAVEAEAYSSRTYSYWNGNPGVYYQGASPGYYNSYGYNTYGYYGDRHIYTPRIGGYSGSSAYTVSNLRPGYYYSPYRWR